MTAPGFPLLLRVVPALVPHALRGLFSTCSVRVIRRDLEREYVRSGRGFVGAVWHKDFLFVLDYFRRRKIVVMVSRSRDGELVARTLHRLGYRTARGSSSAGGAEALREVVDSVRQDRIASIIVDGPRGPARTAKAGVVTAARLSGKPILPFVAHAEPAIRLHNWDGTMIPLPFSRIAAAWGDPIFVPPDASPEECERIRAKVDRAMAELEVTCRRALEAGGG